MKKTTIFSLILFSALFLSACGIKENGTSTTTPSLQQEETKNSSFSLRDLIAKNIPQKCTWSSTDAESESTGTILVSGNKFNQKVNLKSGEDISILNSISDGTYLYSWQENSNEMAAFKMKVDIFEKETNEVSEEQASQLDSNQSLDLDQQIEYNCSPASLSDSDFQPPKNIEFIDYSQFMQDIQSKAPSLDISDYQ